jgi:polysaccharide pyruvyl transferase WcaK-like protein
MKVPTVCYVGWHDRGNIGDDAIFEAVRDALLGAQLIDLPLYRREAALSMARVLRLRHSETTLVLGGGTCIGRRNWRAHVRRGIALANLRAAYAIGAGVEDPVFRGRHSYSDKGELKRWAPLLRSFGTVSVRGPRSADLLSTIGIDAAVVGDPALLLPRPIAAAVSPGRIGVNLGFGDDLWGHDPAAVATEMARACKVLEAQGFTFHGILLNGKDRKWTEWALREVTGPVTYVSAVNSAQALRELAGCSAVVVSRLHAAVLASISGTPAVALEYQPKCRDFALSIGTEDALLRTDTVSAGQIVGHVSAAINDRDQVSHRTLAAVALLRTRLTEAYDLAREALGLPRLEW